MKPQLFPRQPKRMKQPSKHAMREHLRLAADEIIRLRMELERPWWKRLQRRSK